MSTLNERVTKVEIYTEEHSKEIESLRKSRHEHNNLLHNYGGQLSSHESIITGITNSVDKLTKAADRMLWVCSGGMAVGIFLISLIVYVFKDIPFREILQLIHG